MGKSETKITDIKRLFAYSGNRCAFPKCRTPVFLDGTLVGKVCHIKGANPGSARYDSAQSDEDRHGYDNLVVMCGVHHDVIDDDEISYSVERLRQIKLDHEVGASPLSEPEVTQITNIYIQSLSAEPKPGLKKSDREIQAIERIWNTMVNLRKEFSDVVFIDTILIPSELDAFFGGRKSHQLFDTILHYRDELTIMHKTNRAGVEDAPRERPFVDPKLFAAYSVQLGLLARAAMLLHFSFGKHAYQDWRNDPLILSHISSIVPLATVDRLKSTNTFSLLCIANEIDQIFNEIARD